MVRRWTGVIFLNQELNLFCCFQKCLYINIKKLVRFKKYVLLISRRKRKQITRLKEFSNYLIYTQILNSWSLDFQEKKAVFRYYYYLGSYLNLYSIVNFYNYNKNARWDDLTVNALSANIVVRKPNRLSKFVKKFFCNQTDIKYYYTYRFLTESLLFSPDHDFVLEMPVKVIKLDYDFQTNLKIFSEMIDLPKIQDILSNYVYLLYTEVYKIFNLLICFFVFIYNANGRL